jgi:protein tyrosine/serine phosphatase
VNKPLGVVLLLGAAFAPWQVAAAVEPSESARAQAAFGSKLNHFGSVDYGVYKGSKPKTDADYRFLQSLHVKYIVDLQVLPLTILAEQQKAKRYGITVIQGDMNASPIPPSEKHVNQILAILRDKRYHPIYFHCKYGRDRTTVIAALYKMYFQGMPPQAAMQYLRESGYGFEFGWVRSGLIRYLKDHPTPPPSLVSNSAKAVRSR